IKTTKMKKVILIFSIGLFSLTSNAQVNLSDGGGMLSFRKSPEFTDANTAGSKYLSENYQNARVNKGEQSFLIRYNAYRDIMKEKDIHFTFHDGNTYELFSYDLNGRSLDRYHKVLVDNKTVKISKFESIKLLPAKKAINSYERDTQATYKPNSEVYFITYNNQTFEFDGKQKSLEKIISGKGDVIKAFYKENKIKENDSDMIKLGNFLATI